MTRRSRNTTANATGRGWYAWWAALAFAFLLTLIILILVATATYWQRRGSLRSGAYARQTVQDLLFANGVDVRIGGSRPWDMHVVDDRDGRLFVDIVASGNIAMGEAYMNGEWYCPRLDVMFTKLLDSKAHYDLASRSGSQQLAWWTYRAMNATINMQSERRAWEVGEKHYDAGNDLFHAMLDARMTYTCGYWERARTLDEAQADKLEMCCRKIGLHLNDGARGPMVVLDIGCGWGSFMEYAAEKYGAKVIGLSVSREQVKWGEERLRGHRRHLSGLLEYRLQDYRDVLKSPYEFGLRFDAVVSIEMIEAVGKKNLDAFFDVAHTCLKPRGVFLLQAIGRMHTYGPPDQWIQKYIFPNGELPALSQIARSIERPGKLFVVEDLQNLGVSYDKTLMAWNANFQRAWHEDMSLREKYGLRFKRMWEYYLLTCAAAFRSRDIQLYQCVLSKGGVTGGVYRRPSLPSSPPSS